MCQALNAWGAKTLFQINSGKAYYRSRVLNSRTYQKNKAAKRVAVTEVGTVAAPDPCMTIMGRFMTRFLTIPSHRVSGGF